MQEGEYDVVKASEQIAKSQLSRGDEMIAGQLVFDGLGQGLVFVILATGLVLITSVNKMLFMAYGMFYTIGAYTTWYVTQSLHMNYVLGLFAAILATGLIGVAVYLLVFQRLQKVEGGFMATLIASIGLMMMLNQANLLVFGTQARGIPSVINGIVTLGGVTMPVAKIALIVIGIAVCVALFLVYEKTSLGRSMRAVSILPDTARLHGINGKWICMISLGLGTALAGIAGGLIAPINGMNTDMGTNVVWTVLLMCMLGGMDSLLGALAGGLVIGQVLSFGQYYLQVYLGNGALVQILLFIIIGVVLYFKPNGLLGRGVDVGV